MALSGFCPRLTHLHQTLHVAFWRVQLTNSPRDTLADRSPQRERAVETLSYAVVVVGVVG